ncbi:YggS family pyridoxal phosphate-dependent enzyme [Sphingomonas sp. LHG3406-1]|uniref:YggS family pyridoxal phosphate-dependent enzyme n=1 Tax=Sphingomonas sp. LHG3406-1 TaxID=2804617 RepID=UPI00260FABF5|nr:YggS family pyridoxal phosphate-dependent enzyme [Sphingomonas sp. LHG3406-1]
MSDAAARLAAVHATIADAARVARRKPEDVTLVAVSKGRPAEAIEQLIAAGQRDFGENRVQEAAAKWPSLRARYPDVRLHMIGRLQSNKAEEVVGLFDVIHSLDRASLRDALVKAGWSGPTYVQVNVGEEEQKGGVSIGELPAFIASVRDMGLDLAGLMAIPPADVEASPYFALLAKLARRHDVTGLSMGMSGDYRSAVMLGATVVRVGTALFED